MGAEKPEHAGSVWTFSVGDLAGKVRVSVCRTDDSILRSKIEPISVTYETNKSKSSYL